MSKIPPAYLKFFTEMGIALKPVGSDRQNLSIGETQTTITNEQLIAAFKEITKTGNLTVNSANKFGSAGNMRLKTAERQGLTLHVLAQRCGQGFASELFAKNIGPSIAALVSNSKGGIV